MEFDLFLDSGHEQKSIERAVQSHPCFTGQKPNFNGKKPFLQTVNCQLEGAKLYITWFKVIKKAVLQCMCLCMHNGTMEIENKDGVCSSRAIVAATGRQNLW